MAYPAPARRRKVAAAFRKRASEARLGIRIKTRGRNHCHAPVSAARLAFVRGWPHKEAELNRRLPRRLDRGACVMKTTHAAELGVRPTQSRRATAELGASRPTPVRRRGAVTGDEDVERRA